MHCKRAHAIESAAVLFEVLQNWKVTRVGSIPSVLTTAHVTAHLPVVVALPIQRHANGEDDTPIRKRKRRQEKRKTKEEARRENDSNKTRKNEGKRERIFHKNLQRLEKAQGDKYIENRALG